MWKVSFPPKSIIQNLSNPPSSKTTAMHERQLRLLYKWDNLSDRSISLSDRVWIEKCLKKFWITSRVGRRKWRLKHNMIERVGKLFDRQTYSVSAVLLNETRTRTDIMLTERNGNWVIFDISFPFFFILRNR